MYAFAKLVSGYVKTHEKFLAVILGCILLWALSGKVQSVLADHDAKQYEAKAAQLQATVAANALLAQSNAKAAADYQTLSKQVLADNSRLERESAALRDALARQQTIDRNLPPADLAHRIETLANIPPGSVVPAPHSFAVSPDGAVGIAIALEQVPVLTAQLGGVQQEKANLDKQLVAQSARVSGLDSEITGLKTELVQADGVCSARIKVVKDDASKGKRKWFVVGYMAGLATRGLVKIFGGI